MPDFDNYDDVREALTADPSVKDVFDDVRNYLDAVGAMKSYRVEKTALTVEKVADMLECDTEAIRSLEEGMDVEVSLLQRYARALDIRLVVVAQAPNHDGYPMPF